MNDGELELGVVRRAREGDDVADVGHARHEQDEALEAQAEAAVGHGAEAAGGEGPPPVLHGGATALHPAHKPMSEIGRRGTPMRDRGGSWAPRRFGTVPHSGFGLGFERLVLFVSGIANTRAVNPYPRPPNTAEF